MVAYMRSKTELCERFVMSLVFLIRERILTELNMDDGQKRDFVLTFTSDCKIVWCLPCYFVLRQKL